MLPPPVAPDGPDIAAAKGCAVLLSIAAERLNDRLFLTAPLVALPPRVL
jgi:hypothetical protein